MRYLNPSTRLKLNEIILRINNKQTVTLPERILLSKYLGKYPHLNLLFILIIISVNFNLLEGFKYLIIFKFIK